MKNLAQVRKLVENTCVLHPGSSIHGVQHWMRVLDNGLEIAQHTGADTAVVELFAILHDSRRYNEDADPDHGKRGALWARALWARDYPGLAELDRWQIGLLERAIEGHSDGYTTDDPTIGTCWDADRLDLGRVGVMPVPRLLSTKYAKAWLIRQPQLFAPRPRASQEQAHSEPAPAPAP